VEKYWLGMQEKPNIFLEKVYHKKLINKQIVGSDNIVMRISLNSTHTLAFVLYEGGNVSVINLETLEIVKHDKIEGFPTDLRASYID